MMMTTNDNDAQQKVIITEPIKIVFAIWHDYDFYSNDVLINFINMPVTKHGAQMSRRPNGAKMSRTPFG